MAGTPKARAKRELLPSLYRSVIPDETWRQMTEAEKVIALWGGNLENVRKLVSIPFEHADLHERKMQMQVHDGGLKFVLRMLAKRDREHGRADVLEQLRELLAGDGSAPTPVREHAPAHVATEGEACSTEPAPDTGQTPAKPQR